MRRNCRWTRRKMITQRNDLTLHSLLAALTSGQIVEFSWLQAQGFSRSLIHELEHQGSLEQLSARVYRRRVAPEEAPCAVSWEVAVTSAQSTRPGCFHVGGPTALEMLGQIQDLQPGNVRRIHLYDPIRASPSWLLKVRVDATFILHKRKLFADQSLGVERHQLGLASERPGLPLPGHPICEPGGHAIPLAAPERAAIEAVNAVPHSISFEQADTLFQGLTKLQPELLSALLRSCCSVRAKRLFLFYVDRHQHDWADKLDRYGIDLGHGRRLLAPRGKMDAHYQITVPAALLKPMRAAQH